MPTYYVEWHMREAWRELMKATSAEDLRCVPAVMPIQAIQYKLPGSTTWNTQLLGNTTQRLRVFRAWPSSAPKGDRSRRKAQP